MMSNYTSLFLFVMPAYVLLLIAEWIVWRRDPDRTTKRGFYGRDTASSLGINVLSQLVRPLERFFIPFSFVVVGAAITPLHLPTDQWWTWVLALVLTDFCYYWAHRADHRIRLLWTAHSVHHSSEHFNLSTAVRMPGLIPGAAFLRNAAWFPAALVGVPAWLIIFCQTLVLIYQWPLHTERVGFLWKPIEFVFNTPSHHRVHHGSNNPFLDKNYGAILIVWDRIFGSYAHEVEPVVFGLTKNINTYNPIKANWIEFVVMLGDVRRSRTWRDRVGSVFGPPGRPITSAAPVAAASATASASEIPVSV